MPVFEEQVVEDVWIASEKMATKRSRLHRFTSAASSKYRKLKKPGNVAKTASSAVGNFIPVPALAGGTDWAIQTAVDKYRAHRRKSKLKTDLSDDKIVKHGIKNMDISALDRARFKVQHLIQSLNKDLQSEKGKLSLCISAFKLAYRYHRVKYRVQELRLQAEVMYVLAEAIKKWCDDVDRNVNRNEGNVVFEVDARLCHVPQSCGGAMAERGCLMNEANSQKLNAKAEKFMAQLHDDD